MKYTLNYARDLDFDVCNAMNIMDNNKFITDLRFGMGDGQMQFYLYNYVAKGIVKSGGIGAICV